MAILNVRFDSYLGMQQEKIHVIKLICDATNLGLKEAIHEYNLLFKENKTVYLRVPLNRIKEIKTKFEEYGATTSIDETSVENDIKIKISELVNFCYMFNREYLGNKIAEFYRNLFL